MRTELVAAALLVSTCASCRGADESSSSAPSVATESREPPLAAKEFFRLDVAPLPACKAGAACEATLVLTALGDYKVNDEYPFKLVLAEPPPGITVDRSTFTPAGKTGTMAIAFTADKPGRAKINGTFKLSVCNADNCQIESPKIAFDVTAK